MWKSYLKLTRTHIIRDDFLIKKPLLSLYYIDDELRMTDVIDAALATAGSPCELGNDPSKYLERFEDWYEHTSLLGDAIGLSSDAQKLKLMMLWGGKDFRKMVKDANVVTVAAAGVAI